MSIHYFGMCSTCYIHSLFKKVFRILTNLPLLCSDHFHARATAFGQVTIQMDSNWPPQLPQLWTIDSVYNMLNAFTFEDFPPKSYINEAQAWADGFYAFCCEGGCCCLLHCYSENLVLILEFSALRLISPKYRHKLSKMSAHELVQKITHKIGRKIGWKSA